MHADLPGRKVLPLRLRELTDEERAEVQRIARSHTLGGGIVVHALGCLKAKEIATRMDLCGNTDRHWLNRFYVRGLKGLKEARVIVISTVPHGLGNPPRPAGGRDSDGYVRVPAYHRAAIRAGS